MDICLLPHAFWNPARPSRRATLAEILGETSGGDAIGLPLTWRDPRHVFVATDFDLFAEDDNFVRSVFDVMAQAEHHEFQVETACSDRLLELSPRIDWRSNIWMGVSVERPPNLVRIDDLRHSGAQVRFAHFARPMAVQRSDLAELDFVMVDTTGTEAPPTLETACVTAGCRLFLGEPETANERTLARGEDAGALWVPGRERR